MTGTSHIPAELLAEMTPAVRVFVEGLLAANAALEARVASLEATVWALQAENEQLRAQVKRLTPQNSSLPPSSQHPHAKPSKQKKSANGPRKKRGGQPGHPRQQRTLIPTEDCAAVIPCVPDACRQCGEGFGKVEPDPEPLRQQVWDVEIKSVVTEYQQHRRICQRCETSTCGALPEHVNGGTGPVLTALLVLLTSCYRVSRSKAADFAAEVCGVPCSAAHVSDLEGRTQALLNPVYQQLSQAAPAETRLKVDETPYRRGGVKTWLWTIVAAQFTVFRVAATRKARELTSIIGETYQGIINCDRAKMYYGFQKLQWCWAHLKRDFQKLIDSDDGQLKRLGRDLMREVIQLFHEYHRFRDGTITFEQLQESLAPVRQRVESLLLRGHGTAADGMCRELFRHRAHLWTFLEDELVEPTNNGSERSLRHGVIWRKLSFGTQSLRGDRYVETMLTVIETCRQQKRRVFDYLVSALRNRAPETLLPQTTQPATNPRSAAA